MKNMVRLMLATLLLLGAMSTMTVCRRRSSASRCARRDNCGGQLNRSARTVMF